VKWLVNGLKALPTTCTGVQQKTLGGDENEMAVWWKSLIEHLHDEHENRYHTQDLGDRFKKWLQQGRIYT